MISLDEYLFSTTELLDDALSSQIADLLKTAIEKRNSAILILSGGNTPKGMLTKLSHINLPWEKVTVLLADERWVGPEHERSNEKMLRACFLKQAAKKATFIGFHMSSVDAEDAPPLLEEKLRMLEHPADVVVLGMGEDGHTASLFPCAKSIEQLLGDKNQLKTVMVAPQTAPDKRISLSYPILKNAENIFVHFTGDLKKEIFQKIGAGLLEAPIGRLLNNTDAEIRLYWAQ